MKKYRIFILILLWAGMSPLWAQTARRSLDYYIGKATESSPLAQDRGNQESILESEKQYMKNMYTHAQTLLTGNYLFVPIISKDNGTTAFKWNAQSANDYYGYDLGVSNGNVQGGITWNKPLLGASMYKAAETQLGVQHDILQNNFRLNRHDIERNVTDQYILCMLDRNMMGFADSVSHVLSVQTDLITRLARAGQAKQSDVQLITIEQRGNDETRAACAQSYHNHLMELNALCCIKDTALVEIEKTSITETAETGASRFLTKYALDSISAVASQRMYETKYKPQLNLFTSFGLQATHYSTMYKNFGLSAGLTFSMLLSDGKLKRIRQRETDATLRSIDIYKNNLKTQNEIRLSQCTSAIRDYDTRLQMLNAQMTEYKHLLDMCEKEIRAGQMSVFDYITTLKNMISVQQQKMTTEANRTLAVNAYNYYNW